ncbi:MAG: ABC transporter ATP-binding protein [Acutalibacteraceae bacterium]
MSTVINLENLEKCYNKGKRNEVTALSGVNLEISEGEMIAVCGTSGSGKSTLLNIIGCVDTPTSGKYYLFGEDVSAASQKKLAALRNKCFGYVFQEYILLGNRSVYDNVSIPLAFSDVPSSRFSPIINEMLKKLGIYDVRKFSANALSGGQRQRIAIARALVNDPAIILADEPTGALDIKTGDMIMDCLCDINKSGKTVLVVTHDSKIAARCQRIITIEDGRLLEDLADITRENLPAH